MDNRRDSKNRKDDHASSSLIKYKGREHWPRTKYHLECHFDSHGLQGLIIKGKVHRPAGGFITTHINPVTMSVIRDAAAADNTNEGTVVPALGEHAAEAAPQGEHKEAAPQDQANQANTAMTEVAARLREAIGNIENEEQRQAVHGQLEQLQPFLVTTRPDTVQIDTGEHDTSLLADLRGAAKDELTKLKLIRGLSDECTIIMYAGFDERLKTALWNHATNQVYNTIKISLGWKYRSIIRGIDMGDGHSAWHRLVLYHNNKTASSMSGYLKEYQNEQQDTAVGPRWFADYAQSLADIADQYQEASRGKKTISEELRRSRYLQLAERYSHIVETIETEDDKRMEQDEKLQTADEIETLIRRWERRKHIALDKKMQKIKQALKEQDKATHKAYSAKGGRDRDRSNDTCNICGEKGHWARDCPQNKQSPPGPCPICQNSKTKKCEWHWRNECPNSKKVAAAKAAYAADSESDSDDGDIDWEKRYKLAKRMYHRQQQGMKVPKALTAWHKLSRKKGKDKSGQTHLVVRA